MKPEGRTDENSEKKMCRNMILFVRAVDAESGGGSNTDNKASMSALKYCVKKRQLTQ